MNAYPEPNAERQNVFSRIVVGIDGSDQSREAVRQAAILADGELTLLAAYTVAPAIGGTGVGVPYYQDEDVLRAAATDMLERVRKEVAPASATGKVVFGRPADALVAEVEQEQQTLLVVGSHGRGRVAGFVVGSTANEVIRRLPCSVLVARGGGNGFPSRVVVGVDGSPGSAAAYAVARHLSERLGAELLPVVALGGKGVDGKKIDLVVGNRREQVQESPEKPVDALLAAAADADLLVVGSRGLHGLKALGSVSERIAQRAGSSVLIVREPGSPGGE